MLSCYLRLPYYFSIWRALFFAKLTVKCLPFKVWSKSCGIFQAETLKYPLEDIHELKGLAPAFHRMKRYLPWSSRCLEQAFAAHRLLSQKKCDHTIYFGLIKDANAQWRAHAWVRAGDFWVIGYSPHEQYTVVGTYAAVFSARVAKG